MKKPPYRRRGAHAEIAKLNAEIEWWKQEFRTAHAMWAAAQAEVDRLTSGNPHNLKICPITGMPED